MILLDASVLLAAEDMDDLEHAASVALLRTGDLATIDLAVYEVMNIAISRWRDSAASARLQQRIWAIADSGTLLRVDVWWSDAVATVAAPHGLSAYDAAYVAGARMTGATLASCDRRDLVAAGHACLPSKLVT